MTYIVSGGVLNSTHSLTGGNNFNDFTENQLIQFRVNCLNDKR